MTLNQAVNLLNVHQYRDCAAWVFADGVVTGPTGVSFEPFEVIAIATALAHPWILDIPYGGS